MDPDKAGKSVMAEGGWGVPWLVWAGLAAVAGALFTVFQIPDQTSQTVGIIQFVLRWFHAITWFLLALSFLLRALSPRLSGVANVVALAGLAAYLGFWAAVLRTGE